MTHLQCIELGFALGVIVTALGVLAAIHRNERKITWLSNLQ